MKAVILARVSTEMQEDGFSLDAQLDRLRNYCSLKDLEIAKEFTFVESSFHGKRTKFYEAVNYIKRQSKLTALVVDTVDRLQRTFKVLTLRCGRCKFCQPICLSIQLVIMLSVLRSECSMRGSSLGLHRLVT